MIQFNKTKDFFSKHDRRKHEVCEMCIQKLFVQTIENTWHTTRGHKGGQGQVARLLCVKCVFIKTKVM